MLLSIADQVIILLASVYGGLILGLIFDLYRFVRGIFRFGKTFTVIGDMLFLTVGLILTLMVVYKSSSGLVRVYQLLGFGLGMALYIRFMSDAMQSILRTFMYCIKGLLYNIIRVLRGPVIVLSNILWKPCSVLKGRTTRALARMVQDVRKYIPMLRNKK